MSVQHLAQVAASLQHAPEQAVAGLEQEPLLQVEQQPVVRKIPATATSARVIIIFMLLSYSWLVSLISPAAATSATAN